MLRRIVPVALLCLGLGSAEAADLKPKLAVLDFQPNGASKELASAVSGVAANEIERIGAFKVVTTEAIRQMLALEKQKQMLGCTDAGCLAEIGGALGVEYLVGGKVSKIAGQGGKHTFTLELTLSNVKKALREASDIGTAPSEAELMSYIPRGVAKLLAKQLADRSGRLTLSAAESGAIVRIDDQVKGTTPLPSHLTVPAGTHVLSVEKEGFVTYVKEIHITPSALTDERVTLMPSPDYVQGYEKRAKKMRRFAWISTAAAGAGLLTFGALQINASRLYGDEKKDGTFLFYRSKLDAGIERDGNVDYRAQATKLKSRVDTSEIISFVGAGIGAAGLVAGTYFWIAGDDPNKYVRFKETASLGIQPLTGGAYASISGAF